MFAPNKMVDNVGTTGRPSTVAKPFFARVTKNDTRGIVYVTVATGVLGQFLNILYHLNVLT